MAALCAQLEKKKVAVRGKSLFSSITPGDRAVMNAAAKVNLQTWVHYMQNERRLYL